MNDCDERTNHINESKCFSLPRQVNIYPLQTSLVISSLLRTDQNSPVLKALSHKTTFLAFCLSILMLRCKVARNAIRSTPNNTRKSNMSPGDVYLPHKRREKWTRLYNVLVAAWCNENVATHGSFAGGVTPGKFLSLNRANRNTYESRRVTISWLCKAAGQEILISDWVNTSCYSAYKIYTPNISCKM